MPKRSRSQAIGSAGERWFVAQLPDHWIPQLPTADVGVDVLVVICEEGVNNGLEFKVQVKSSTKWKRKDDHILVDGFRRESLIDLLRGFSPALLVLYETSSDSGYCVWLNQLLANDPTVIQGPQKTVTLRVSLHRPIEETLWPTLAAEVRGVYRAVASRVTLAGLSLPILHATHSLMRSLHLLDLCASGEGGTVPPNELIEAEITAHKEIVLTLRALQLELSQGSGAIIGLDQTAKRYEAECESFLPGFGEFVSGVKAGTEFQLLESGLIAHRSIAWRAVTQVVEKLSMLSLQGVRSTTANDA